MKREDAADLANELMSHFGIAQKGWKFAWMKRKRTLGLCSYQKMQILLSESYVDLNNEWSVEQTIRHEIAHAIAGYKAAHGPDWVLVAYECGVDNPKAKCTDTDLVMAKGRYQATCETCSHVYSFHKLVKNIADRYCQKCYARAGSVPGSWTNHRLTFVDTQRMNAPVTNTRVPVSAFQSPRVQIVSAVSETARDERTETPTVQWVNAVQLAAAMKIDGKTLRAWLRRNGGRSFQVDGKYQFTEADVRYLVLKWNESH